MRWSDPGVGPTDRGAPDTDIADFSVAINRTAASVVVTVDGCLDAAAAPLLDSLLSDLIVGQGNLSIVVDLREVDRLETPAVAVIEAAAQMVARRGGELTVADGPAAGEITA